MLAVIETHPIHYHAPVYRTLTARFGVPVTAIYASDFSTKHHQDAEFGAHVEWPSDLLDGYEHRFLSHADPGTRPDVSALSAHGLDDVLARLSPAATLITGYSPAFHRRAWLAAWRLHRPVLFRGETSDIAQSSELVVTVRNAALRLAYRSCARLLYIGTRSRRHYQQLGVSDDRLVFSPYCVDTTPFLASESDRAIMRLDVRRRLGIGERDYVILFSGKLSHRKGVDLLVAAARRLPDAIRATCAIVCAGDGALRDAIRVEAEQTPRLPVHVLGVLPQSGLSPVYHMADVLVLPSRKAETWGLVVNEALHHGLPCVVSDRVGCGVDLIDDRTGVTCRADDEASLADAISEAWLLRERPDVREACRQKIAPFSVERAAEGIALAYHAVTGAAVAK